MNPLSVGYRLDRISDLPNNVIQRILAFLPFCDAVRTCALSKKWKDKWLTLPHIIIDEELFPTSFSRSLEGVINDIFTKHQGKIEKFCVFVEVKDSYNVQSWLWTLAQKGIQELSLLYLRGRYNEVPSNLFSDLQQLKTLSLHRCVLKPPRSPRGFQRLISLELNKVHIKAAEFEKLISNCPLLEQLTLRKLYCLNCPRSVDHLKINVPKLKYFCFDGEFISICLNTPFLEVLSINLYRIGYYREEQDQFLLSFQFCGLPTLIQELYVRCEFQKYMAACERFTEVVTYSHLRTLQLDEFCFEKEDQVRCLLSLFGSSCNLITLDITACKCESEVDSKCVVTTFWEEQKNAALELNQLKKVRVRLFRAKDPEMKLIQCVMRNSPVLEEITVEYITSPTFDEGEVKGVLQVLCKTSTRLSFIAVKNLESEQGSDGSQAEDYD